MAQRDRERREAEWQAKQDERARRREREYQRAIAAGGDTAAEARWRRLHYETIDATESRYSLCQWALDNGQPGACTHRSADVYCWRHNRQLERETEKRRRQREAEAKAEL